MPDKRRGERVSSHGSSKKLKTDDSTSTGEVLAYEPVHFIRSHSKNNDPADIQTQIWEVVFEPDAQNSDKTTTLVATCGGNSICIIDVNAGTVLMKYKHKDLKENFYTLAWTTLNLEGEKTNILVSGGIRGEIRMFHPKHRVCFHEWRPVDKKSIAVNSLVFHSEKPTWLFCGTSDGYVTLWDIGSPSLPSYDGVNPVQLLRLYPDYGDVYNIAWSGKNRWLLAGTAAGLVGWNIDDEEVKEKGKEYKPKMVDFIMPESKRDEGENPIVDSLAIASEWNIVSKCALHGLIYVWDLKATIETIKVEELKTESDDDAVIEQDVKMLARLRWSDTDNFYMNLGCHKGKGLICCGDDKGSLWLYNLPQFGKDDATPIKDTVDHSARLNWPELQDDHLENTRKIPLDRHNIIIDKVAASHDNTHIVAVTSNNMVCIWKRTDESASSTLSGGGGGGEN
eukprot:maker-scaffold676_size113663-snap-gene-0.33 protein:Tk06498 transcript:maker-scaffold676_size113663-snap-gene-0.33-mRNA-1 annotation:"leucine-rich repeat and wd repeat-containing protein 1"